MNILSDVFNDNSNKSFHTQTSIHRRLLH